MIIHLTCKCDVIFLWQKCNFLNYWSKAGEIKINDNEKNILKNAKVILPCLWILLSCINQPAAMLFFLQAISDKGPIAVTVSRRSCSAFSIMCNYFKCLYSIGNCLSLKNHRYCFNARVMHFICTIISTFREDRLGQCCLCQRAGQRPCWSHPRPPPLQTATTEALLVGYRQNQQSFMLYAIVIYLFIFVFSSLTLSLRAE